MTDNEFQLAEAMALLQQTPATLRALLAAVPPRWQQPGAPDDGWSPHTVIQHLIAGERSNWMVRAQHILGGSGAPFEPFDREAQALHEATASTAELLGIFAELRAANLATLGSLQLTPDDLRRTGQHPEFGAVQLGQLLATWAVHDLDHLRQLTELLARNYAVAVGPWRSYLGVLQPQG